MIPKQYYTVIDWKQPFGFASMGMIFEEDKFFAKIALRSSDLDTVSTSLVILTIIREDHSKSLTLNFGHGMGKKDGEWSWDKDAPKEKMGPYPLLPLGGWWVLKYLEREIPDELELQQDMKAIGI